MVTVKSMAESGQTFKLQAYTIVAFAKLYGVNKRTFKGWLRPFLSEIGERQGYYYNIRQVQIIIDKIGLPSEIPLDD
ncbi:hypothetical protein C7475_112159 [Chitinophaga sp. S165]|nr:hypothetical protein C7475_112159 [Chitinophaga sp. S165]